MPDPTPISYWLNARTLIDWHRRGIIEAGALMQLLDIARYARLPSLRRAALRVIRQCGCGHMIGERRMGV